MKITRKDVLDAIEQETLMAGDWVGYEMNGTCPVCAVGATLRRAGLTDTEIRNRAGEICRGWYISSHSIPAALSEGNYLGALSSKWERICETYQPSDWWTWSPKDLVRYKGELRAFVLENFPDGVIYDDEQLP